MDLSSFVRRDISGIRKDILPLSGFGILSHALADEIAARNQAREGYFYTTDMELLEEGEPEQQPMLPPMSHKPETVRMDMNILFKIVQESGENGKALPAGTRKMLERVRTILRADPQGRPMSAPQTVQQRNIPLTQRARSAPAMPLTQSVPSVSSAQAVRAAQPVSPMPRQMRAARPLPQNRMQNPLRDPKVPLTVERLHTPTHEVPRASDHAMLFSDVLHRAQDSGLTFAPRQGQGGVPASAQTRAAYTTQALRQARAEQQAAEAQNAPAWQRNTLREASQTPPGVAGASWRFGETARNGDAVGAMAAMAAPRYPEAELDLVQEDTPREGAEMPVSPVQHPGAESIRAVQEASAKALTETVRSALKEAAPLMTAPAAAAAAELKQAEQAEQKIAARTVQSASAEMAMRPARAESPAQTAGQSGRQTEAPQGGQMAAPGSRSVTISRSQQANQSTGTPRAKQAGRSIPPQTDSVVENREEEDQTENIENAGKAAEMSAATADENTAGTIETPAVKSEAQSVETANRQTEMSAGVVDAEHPGVPEYAGEHIPALTGDRTFVQTSEEAESFLSRMAASRYPEAELNFAQEAALQEGAEILAAMAQHPGAETLRAVQETSAKALTETVHAALKEAAPLMTAPAATTAARNTQSAQKATARAVQSAPAETAVRPARAESPAQTAGHPGRQTEAPQGRQTAVPGSQSVMTSQARQADRSTGTPWAQQADRNIPLRSDSMVEKREEENRAENAKNAEGTGKAAEMSAVTAAEYAAGTTETLARDRIPALTGDRTFVQTSEEAESLLSRMAASRYPEAELNFAQENAPQEGAEMPAAMAQHPGVESIRAVQEASAKALTETVRSALTDLRPGGELPGGSDTVHPAAGAGETESRLPPLSGGQMGSGPLDGQITGRFAGQNAGQAGGQTGGMERAVELLRQNGYGAPQLEYRMEDAGPEAPGTTQMPQTPELSRQAGAAAERSLLWLGEKVAANAARELSRMQQAMPSQGIRSGSASSAGSAMRRDQPGYPGGVSLSGQMDQKSQPGRAFRMMSHPASQTAGWMGYRPIEMAHPAAQTPGWTAARPMGIPAEAQWKPGGQAAPTVVSPAEMPSLMYQTGQAEGGEVPFVPTGSSAKTALPQPGSSLEAQSVYPALSMEYSSPMSRMEQQLQSTVAQQMSAASRPMGMQTEAGQYMAGKAAPGGMTTLDQMSAPPVNDQIVWQNPYLRSAPADMTYRSKKKPPEQPQPAPRPQTVRMSDAEIHRMADQVFRIVKDKIRQERRKMGL